MPHTTTSVSEDDAVIKHSAAFEAMALATAQRIKNVGPMTRWELQELAEVYERAARVADTFFPGAMTSQVAVQKVLKVLESIGCTPENTLFAQSICPDEINHKEGNVPRLLIHNFMDKVFHMGGLAGLPFTGRTGFNAFSHHIPDDGNLFVLYGPHVGISRDGKVGEYSRFGQRCAGKSCGAATGGLQYCCTTDESGIPSYVDLGADCYDYQMNIIKVEIYKRLAHILEQKDQDTMQAELAYQIFDVIESFMNETVHTDFHHGAGLGHSESSNGRLILLGGIQINMPDPMHDFFLPLTFEIRRQNHEPVNILEQTFGHIGRRLLERREGKRLPSTKYEEVVALRGSDKTQQLPSVKPNSLKNSTVQLLLGSNRHHEHHSHAHSGHEHNSHSHHGHSGHEHNGHHRPRNGDDADNDNDNGPNYSDDHHVSYHSPIQCPGPVNLKANSDRSERERGHERVGKKGAHRKADLILQSVSHHDHNATPRRNNGAPATLPSIQRRASGEDRLEASAAPHSPTSISFSPSTDDSPKSDDGKTIE